MILTENLHLVQGCLTLVWPGAAGPHTVQAACCRAPWEPCCVQIPVCTISGSLLPPTATTTVGTFFSSAHLPPCPSPSPAGSVAGEASSLGLLPCYPTPETQAAFTTAAGAIGAGMWLDRSLGGRGEWSHINSSWARCGLQPWLSDICPSHWLLKYMFCLLFQSNLY